MFVYFSTETDFIQKVFEISIINVLTATIGTKFPKINCHSMSRRFALSRICQIFSRNYRVLKMIFSYRAKEIHARLTEKSTREALVRGEVLFFPRSIQQPLDKSTRLKKSGCRCRNKFEIPGRRVGKNISINKALHGSP